MKKDDRDWQMIARRMWEMGMMQRDISQALRRPVSQIAWVLDIDRARVEQKRTVRRLRLAAQREGGPLRKPPEHPPVYRRNGPRPPAPVTVPTITALADIREPERAPIRFRSTIDYNEQKAAREARLDKLRAAHRSAIRKGKCIDPDVALSGVSGVSQ